MNTNYGCTKCQTRHYSGTPIYTAHLPYQDKHGTMHAALYEPYRPKDTPSDAPKVLRGAEEPTIAC